MDFIVLNIISSINCINYKRKQLNIPIMFVSERKNSKQNRVKFMKKINFL